MVSKAEQTRIAFPDLWEYVSKNELFEQCRNGTQTKIQIEEVVSLNSNRQLVVSQKSKVITMPLHISEG